MWWENLTQNSGVGSVYFAQNKLVMFAVTFKWSRPTEKVRGLIEKIFGVCKFAVTTWSDLH